jgi:nucleotide-binding universal stress UspA family protein
LVPFEISSASYKAFRTALDIAKENKAKLTVLTVVNSNGKTETHGFEHMLPVMVLAEYDQRRAENEWPKLSKEAQNMNIELNSAVLDESYAAKGIVNFAQENKMDLIVMGNGDGKVSKDNFQSSVSQEVIGLHPACQVLVVN